MEKKWTKQQQQVIDLKNRNLLVSAAAGSGKTAVLVERIIQKITSLEHPMDIDRLLVVTFTNAAAAEMRERIGLALGKALEVQPDNIHLQRQQTLLHNAQITTIHSFCLYVIRNYFHRIDLNPDFRVAEEGELKLLKSDVLDQVLEQYYQEANPEFLTLSETIATGKTDLPLKETILRLFDFAMSYPWVDEWLEGCTEPFHVTGMEEFDRLPLTTELLEYLKNITCQWALQIKQCYHISLSENGPAAYEELMQSEAAAMEQIAQSATYQEYYERIRGFSFGRLPTLRKFAGDMAKKEQVQKLRNEVKDSVKKITKQFFFQNPKEMLVDLEKCRPTVDMLIEVTFAFIHAFSEKKREKNILDFNDLEHFALKILVDGQTHEPSQTAAELRKNYDEIMIDEYQDSNNVQETILRAVSKESESRYNIFMVGDVKQSIYRFRMARPELFMEKYTTYTQEDSVKQRVDLHKNFRSRPEVLETVNDIFRKIMKDDIGNITYDDQAALYPGAVFPKGEKGMFDTRLLVIEPKAEEKDLKPQELEARAVGMEIRNLIKSQFVTGKMPGGDDPGKLRPVRYSDIVILLRSPGSWADTFVKVLGEMGIPARAAAGTGYFSALEVQTVLNLLRILDNPRQDIPMAAVLASPIAGLTGEELAILRIQYPKEKFYQAVLHYMPEQELCKEPQTSERSEEYCKKGVAGMENKEPCKDPQMAEKLEEGCVKEVVGVNGQDSYDDAQNVEKIELPAPAKRKLEKFLRLLQKFRKKISYTPIHELLYQVLEETGYQAYVYALPGGEVKKANLDMLVEKAVAYESTSYRGLFHFIRYMDQLQKYEVDFPLAEGEEAEDVVQVMSIHKSKGLEFPVVFVSGLGKMFNNQDVRDRVVLHPGLGIGMDVTDINRRLKTPGLTRQFLSRKIAMENTGEELRVLYVAMTRAKEKLILTGILKKAGEKLEQYGVNVKKAQEGQERSVQEGQESISFLKRLNANTFFQFILMACAAYPLKYPAVLIRQSDLEGIQEAHLAEEGLTKIELLAKLKEADPFWEQEVARRLSYQYPYEEETTMRTKVSVSELKHRAMDKRMEEEQMEQVFQQEIQKVHDTETFQGEGQGMEVFQEEGKEAYNIEVFREENKEESQQESYIPAFMQGVQEENIGARRGTAMHRVLECFDFTREPNTLKEQLDKMAEQKKVEQTLLDLVYLPSLKKFLHSPLAKRIRNAACQGKLYKEKPFVMGKPAKEMLRESESQEMLLIQGIVDVFFEEPDGIVLLDYKTDRVGSEKELADRYQIQLELYQEAIERATGKTVKEKLLYSFCLGKAITV